MANFGRVKTWGTEVLQPTDLNAEFDNIINNITSGGVDADNIDLTDVYAWSGAHTFAGTVGITGVTTHGGNVVSDTDSTDDLGTSSVRWANLFVDSIGDTGQDLTIAATTTNLPSGHVTDYAGADVVLTHSAGVLNVSTGALQVGGVAVSTGTNAVTSYTNTTDNRVITSGGTTVINGEANLTFDGTTMNVVGNAGVGIARTDGTLHVHTASAGVVTAATTADDLVVEHAVEGGISILGGVTVDSHLTMGASNDNAGFDLQYNHTSGAMKWSIAGSDEALTATGARWGIRETTNANQAIGLTINQLTQDDETLALKSSDVAHGVTSIAETDTYGKWGKISATDGGLLCHGLTEGGAYGIYHVAITGTAADTTKSTAATAAYYLQAGLKNGTSYSDHAADSNLFVMATGSATARFIFDQEGSAHADVEWTTFSDGRLKKNVETVPYGLSEVLQLQPKIFDRHSGSIVDGEVVLENDSRRMVGFIAQEVRAIMPELVKEIPNEESFYSLNDGKLAAVIVKAIQELNAKMEN
jgi:hypothetical protein